MAAPISLHGCDFLYEIVASQPFAAICAMPLIALVWVRNSVEGNVSGKLIISECSFATQRLLKLILLRSVSQ
jgi:hypothetical protein